MKTITIFLLLAICVSCTAKDNTWTTTKKYPLENFVSKTVGNITYTMDSQWSIEKREKAIIDAQTYYTECLELIEEDNNLSDSLHIILVNNGTEMMEYLGVPFIGIAALKNDAINENHIFCVHNNKFRPLKHEIMHIICFIHLGDAQGIPTWLVEGLATFANQEYYSCDNLSLKERYLYLLQKNKLLSKRELFQFPSNRTDLRMSRKVAYNQSAYIVKFLSDKYGIKNIKKLWMRTSEEFKRNRWKVNMEIRRRISMDKENEQDTIQSISCDFQVSIFEPIFEDIYKLKFETVLEEINDYLNTEYAEYTFDDDSVFDVVCVE